MGSVTEIDATPRTIFLASLERCACSEDFIPSFYQNLIASSEEIREKFLHTNFDRQHEMLLRSLRLAAEAVAGHSAGLKELRERAETHSRRHLDIEPRFYDLWLMALVMTARDFDDQWENEVERSWHMVLGHVIHHMVIHY